MAVAGAPVAGGAPVGAMGTVAGGGAVTWAGGFAAGAAGGRLVSSWVATFGAGAAVGWGWPSSPAPRPNASWRLSSAMTWTRTLAVPGPTTPRSWALRRERSMMRSLTKGPRSLMRTWICRPLSRLVTRTRVGIGRVLWAAVMASWSYSSPLAV